MGSRSSKAVFVDRGLLSSWSLLVSLNGVTVQYEKLANDWTAVASRFSRQWIKNIAVIEVRCYWNDNIKIYVHS